MTRSDLLAAVAEAQRFVDRARMLLLSKPESFQLDTNEYAPEPWNGSGSPKLSGAVKRASLDLTRALAAMRRRTP